MVKERKEGKKGGREGGREGGRKEGRKEENLPDKMTIIRYLLCMKAA